MPYSSIEDLPPSFKNLTTEQKQAALRMLNAMLKRGMPEEMAIRTALKKGQAMAAEPGSEYWREVSRDARVRLAKEGKAIPVRGEGGEIIDGRYPIVTEEDLRNAIRASGRGAPPDYDSVIKPFVKKRARALGRADLIPENWSLEFAGFAAPAIEGDEEASPEFTVLRTGTFQRGGKEIEVTESDLDKAVANFERWQKQDQEVAVDYDHSFAEKGDSRAAGWIASLKRAGEKLLARVRWNEKALEDLKGGEYRYFSPEFHPDWPNEEGKKEGFTLVGGALTNRPFLRGITRVAFSMERLDQELMGEFVGAVVSMAERLDALYETSGEMAETPAPPETPEVPSPEPLEPEEVTLSQRELQDLRQRAEETERLTQRLQRVERTLADERFTQAFDQAKREGRVDAKPETRERWLERFRKFGHDEARALLFELPAETIPIRERGGNSEPFELEDAPEGVAPDTFVEHQRIERLMAEKEISYEEAAAEVRG